MEPLELGPNLHYAGRQFELWLQRNRWFLYRSEFDGTSFRFFVIIRGDPKPGSTDTAPSWWLEGMREDVNPNVCGPFYANVWVSRDKFMKLARGETRSMTYRAQNRSQYQDRRVRVDLPALQRLSLADVFRVLEGR
jgi:hypothetical protein